MKAIAKTRPERGFEKVDVPTPAIGASDVLVKVKLASICGTDYHIYTWDEWAQSRIKTPRIIGHEFVGEVVAVGSNVTSVRSGDIVTAESHIACGKCYQCRIGRKHTCENLMVLGVDVDGSFAEYVAIPEENALKLWPGLPLEVGSILEPLGNAVHATLATRVSGMTVAVFGCGPIGLSSIAVARASGAIRVIGVEVSPFRLELAKTMGATDTINPTETDAVKEIMDMTGKRGVDAVFEMSGNSKAVRDAFRVVRSGGHVILFGIPSRPVEVDIAEDIIFKEVRVQGIFGREMFKTWYILEGLLKSGRLHALPLITHRMRFDEIDEAMELIGKGDCGKIVVSP